MAICVTLIHQMIVLKIVQVNLVVVQRITAAHVFHSSNDCTQDCAGEWGGSAEDNCGM